MLRFNGRLQAFESLRHHCVHIERHDLHFCLAHLGQEQQFVHDAGHLLRTACDGLQGRLNILGGHPGMIFEQQIRIDEDVGERGLEIMGDCVSERVQFLVALFELGKGALQFVFNPLALRNLIPQLVTCIAHPAEGETRQHRHRVARQALVQQKDRVNGACKNPHEWCVCEQEQTSQQSGPSSV